MGHGPDYTRKLEGSRILENLDELPTILAGDFNVNLVTNDLMTLLELTFEFTKQYIANFI